MKMSSKTCAALTMTAFLASGSSAFAWQAPAVQPAPTSQHDAATEMDTVTGELVQVDPDAMTLTIKSADDTSWTFRYNSDTELSGGQSGVAGLATEAGTLVTVYFEADAADDESVRTAKKIEMDE